ncbi:MAG TPA: hypothetical protein PLQ11_02895, partial [Beijerinckiaceae bacterium]|nr:hypothetical protein [Beijerinckiaceae bacterium]
IGSIPFRARRGDPAGRRAQSVSCDPVKTFFPQGARRTEIRRNGRFRDKSSEKPLDRMPDALFGPFPVLVGKLLRRNGSI